MKKSAIIIVLILFFTNLFAQNFNNNWIDYQNKYLYFKVVEKGIYRINYTTLNSGLTKIGSSVTNPTFSPSQLKLVKNGKEVPIFIEDGGDGKIDPGDFVEFFGDGNDGCSDSALYDVPQSQNNKNFSLFSDTAYYYLTLNTSGSNQRISTYSDFNYSTLNPAPFVYKEAYQQYTSNYETGATDFSGKTESEYTQGEGWFDGVFTYLGSKTKTISTPNPYTGAGAPQINLNTVITGASNASNISGNDHRLGIYLNNNLIHDVSFEGYQLIRFSQNFAATTISGNSTSIKFESLPLPSAPASDRMAVSWVSIEYPQTLNFNGASSYDFFVAPNAAKTRLDVSNFSNSTTQFVYDFNSNSRCAVTQSGNSFQVILPPGPKKRCFVAAETSVKSVNNLIAINGNGNFVDYSQNPPDSAYLVITHNKLFQSANQFALRKQQEGFNTLVINIDELYHQFAFGIRKHPLSIRGFSDYALQSWPTEPQYLFLVGKSISAYLCRTNITNYQNNLVPSFGFPTTDILLTAGLNNTKYQPAIATGRLVAQSSNDVLAYAEKVTQYVQAQKNPYNFENKEWMKNILHFAGGTSTSEQNLLRNYLLDYEETLTDTFFGGEVTSFFKNTSSVIQTNVTDSVKNLINNGVSLLTFFGHALGTALDISIEDVSAYDNFGKYFLFVANSCNVGDIHTPVQSIKGINESFVLTPGKGAIGFIASVTLGYPSRLNQFTYALYKNMSVTNYGKPIGKLMQQAVIDIQGNSSMKSTCHEMTLHGDPSLRINPHQKPEYALSSSRYSISPANISAEMEEFELNVLITNIGKSISKKLNLEVKRTFPDGTDTLFNVEINAPIFKDTVSITLDVLPEKSIGLNQIELALDYPIVTVDEFENVANNVLNIDVWITSDELIPVYPSNQAIAGSSDLKLYSITANPNAANNTYIFQIDTSDQFNSPLFQEISKASSGGVIDWNPTLSLTQDSAVYFWRVTPKPDPDAKWRESSFTIIGGKNGWGQTNFNQAKLNRYNFINYNKPQQKLSFLPNQKQLEAKNIGHPSNQTEYNFIEYRLDGELMEYGVCPPAAPSMYVAIIDSVTLEPWGTHYFLNSGISTIEYNPNNSFGNNNDLGGCRARVENFFTYVLSNPQQVNSLMNLLENEVPVGNYILAYTVIRGDFKDSTIWTNQNFQVFEDLGATQIRNMSDSVPYIFFAQKGRKSSAIEEFGNNFKDIINLTATISNNLPSGSYKTPKIGPAKNWNQLNWKWNSGESNPRDSIALSVIGVTKNGVEVYLDTQKTISGSVASFDTIINAKNYPYLKFEVALEDDSLFTPPQPDYLHVIYDELSEYAVNPSQNFYFKDDTLQQGQDLELQLAYTNLGLDISDSVGLKYSINNGTTDGSLEINRKIKFTEPFQNQIDTLRLSTLNLFGPYTLNSEINPKIPDTLWIPESYTFNNRFSKLFFVKGDAINPSLDVTFDGVHILDGDIVSPSPNIKIRLDDENPYLAVDDTSFFNVYLITPDNIQSRIPFYKNGVENMNFTAATLPSNKAEIGFDGNFNADGVYKLVVQATDATNNRSGDKDYRISFEVINKSTLTEVMNYPNPFSTSTRFVFTLTGNEIPEVFTIQILTISGKVVREITKAELGPINIGRNISEYAWDGRDEFGDPLGNGVYLYRVITKIAGSEIEKRSTDADRFFHKGFGKMYLMR